MRGFYTSHHHLLPSLASFSVSHHRQYLSSTSWKPSTSLISDLHRQKGSYPFDNRSLPFPSPVLHITPSGCLCFPCASLWVTTFRCRCHKQSRALRPFLALVQTRGAPIPTLRVVLSPVVADVLTQPRCELLPPYQDRFRYRSCVSLIWSL